MLRPRSERRRLDDGVRRRSLRRLRAARRSSGRQGRGARARHHQAAGARGRGTPAGAYRRGRAVPPARAAWDLDSVRVRVRHQRAAGRGATGGEIETRGRRGARRVGEGGGMTDVRKILVVGGGIGGLCTTIALRRAGLEVDLVEKNPAWDVYGVGIIQPGNALRALNELGLAKEAVEQGHPIVGDRTWLADGQTELADNDWPPLIKGMPPGNGITRPRLHTILQDHTLDTGADVRTGVTFTTLADTGDGVKVEFTDGDTREYDLVIGADGLYSQVRATAFPDAPKAK